MLTKNGDENWFKVIVRGSVGRERGGTVVVENKKLKADLKASKEKRVEELMNHNAKVGKQEAENSSNVETQVEMIARLTSELEAERKKNE
jgi:hypothetical protein